MTVLRLLSIFACFFALNSHAADHLDQSKIESIVDDAIKPVMQKYAIPGLAIGLTIDGKRYFYNYGVASQETGQPVTGDTLFEIGSISKTFTATLASYAQASGYLSLSDKASTYLSSLRGSSFDNVSLLNLGTHTAGGLPLQVPDDINNTDELIAYFKHWRPSYIAGAYRMYSNPGIGMLGMITAQSMHVSFDEAIEKNIFHELGMNHSYFNIPTDQIKYYAQGYTKMGAPIRMHAGMLAAEAYGVKSTTADMIRFVEANIRPAHPGGKLQQAIVDTHTGYFTAGDMTQDLIWEQYPYPIALEHLLAGNADTMVSQASAASWLNPALPPKANAWINKTGSTNGFAGYVAFIPNEKIGIVILANKNYPIDSRVSAAYQILTRLNGQAQ